MTLGKQSFYLEMCPGKALETLPPTLASKSTTIFISSVRYLDKIEFTKLLNCSHTSKQTTGTLAGGYKHEEILYISYLGVTSRQEVPFT